MKYAVGIDIGGTNTRVALLDKNYQLIHRKQFATDTASPNHTFEQITAIIQSWPEQNICGIGMSCPGPLDLKKGRIIHTPNLDSAWYDFPLTETLSQLTGLPVWLDNDANLAALAEAVAGEGKGYQFVQFLTISTGLGSGFVIDGKIMHGAHGFANEVANACMWEGGPSMGAIASGGIEAIASGTAITYRAQQAGLEAAHAGEVFALAKQGNLAAQTITDDALTYLANFIGVIYSLCDPDIVILGGSVALKTPHFAEWLTERVKTKVMPAAAPYVKIAVSTLNEDSGLIGAGHLAFTYQS